MSRVMAENATSEIHQQISPLLALEHTMIDIISRMARMNEPLTKTGIKALINELIYKTPYEEAFRKYIAA
jgi:hypothetical protein